MTVTVLIGNGLSCGFDGRLATSALTDRVLSRLGPEFTDALTGLAELASPDDVDRPLGVDRGNFEQLAGPVDRIAEAMTAIEALLASSNASVLEGLRTASAELRRLYLKVVGTVLAEVDACCVDATADNDRRDRWADLNAFAAQLIALQRQEGATFFTTNYDSLLMSSLLQSAGTVYDGFAGGSLNVPFDRWASRVALYHLHGSVAWLRTDDGTIQKPSLEAVRAIAAIDEWAAGVPGHGWPSVVLGDLKTRQVARFPFNLFYSELRRQLGRSRLVVVAGYSFGDTPVNRELALYLAGGSSRRLILWSRDPDPDLVYDRLQVQLASEGSVIDTQQVETIAVALPEVAVVSDLMDRLKLPTR